MASPNHEHGIGLHLQTRPSRRAGRGHLPEKSRSFNVEIARRADGSCSSPSQQQAAIHPHADEEDDSMKLKEGYCSDFTMFSEVIKARMLLSAAAALYGTSFAMVKILGETGMSTGLACMLRFGMATLATLPWLLHVDEQYRDRRFQKLLDPSSTEFKVLFGGLEVGKSANS
jgi:hypothetical protein